MHENSLHKVCEIIDTLQKTVHLQCGFVVNFMFNISFECLVHKMIERIIFMRAIKF